MRCCTQASKGVICLKQTQWLARPKEEKMYIGTSYRARSKYSNIFQQKPVKKRSSLKPVTIITGLNLINSTGSDAVRCTCQTLLQEGS